MIKSNTKRKFRSKMSIEKHTVWIGKRGITNQLIDEVLKQLEKKGIIKVKILKSALKTDEASNIIKRVTEETESTLIDKRGHVFTLYKSKKKKAFIRRSVK